MFSIFRYWFIIVLCKMMVMAGYSAEWQETEYGEQCFAPLQNAPYPHISRKNGYFYKNDFFPMETHYNDSTVGFFIPQGFKLRETVDFIVHFHGHTNNVRKATEMFQLTQQLNASGKNLIMLFPQGPKEAIDSGCGKLEEPSGFEKFVLEAKDFLTSESKILPTAEIGRIILSGHSGAYRVLGKILTYGGLGEKIKEVYLFDATYGELDSFANWAAASDKHRLFSIFTEHLTGENIELMSKLQQKGIFQFRLLLDEPELTDEVLRQYRIIFAYTKLGHNFVIQERKHLQRLLATSGVSDK
ncbi:MAG: hypothetical protein N2246_06850 [Candidatus Sumerlaeia bacterium]|nr:hypothetical protein [Candidatus Sumerlaeia bacterium]